MILDNLRVEYEFRYGPVDMSYRDIFSEYFENQIRRPHLSALLDCVSGIASLNGQTEFENSRDQFLRSILSDMPLGFIYNLVDLSEMKRTDGSARIFLEDHASFYIDGYVGQKLNGDVPKFIKECNQAFRNMKTSKKTLNWILKM